VDVARLVVESGIRRGAVPETQVGLEDPNREADPPVPSIRCDTSAEPTIVRTLGSAIVRRPQFADGIRRELAFP
jgi:hypothetical protein